MFDGCYVFTTGGCKDHNFLFFYFAFVSLINLCFAFYWNDRTRDAIKNVKVPLNLISCKIEELDNQMRNIRKTREIFVKCPLPDVHAITPAMNRFQASLPCLQQRLWKKRVCELLNSGDKKVASGL